LIGFSGGLLGLPGGVAADAVAKSERGVDDVGGCDLPDVAAEVGW